MNGTSKQAEETEKTHVQLGQVFEQSKHNSSQIEKVFEIIGDLGNKMDRVVEALNNRINLATAPNFGTIWSAIGVAAAILLGLGTIVTNGLSDSAKRDRDDARRSYEALDSKLQKEFALALEATKEGVKGIDSLSKERQDQAVNIGKIIADRVTRLEQWNDDRIKADLEELRTRRMK